MVDMVCMVCMVYMVYLLEMVDKLDRTAQYVLKVNYLLRVGCQLFMICLSACGNTSTCSVHV